MKIQPIKNYTTGATEHKKGDKPYETDADTGRTLIESGLAKKVEPELDGRKTKVETPEKTK